MKEWSFAKYVACGNDFIIFDNRSEQFPIFPSLIQRLCHRHRGIGADGLLLLEHSQQKQADFRMRIFNSDGSEAEMCGNGLRCFVKWLMSMGFQYPSYCIEVMQTLLTVKLVKNMICIEMGNPRYIQWDIPLCFEQDFLRIHYLNTGVPHAIIFMEDIENIPFLKLGIYIRNYSLWSPAGTNVTITEVIKNQIIKTRTYERGIEGETGACGTGATAAALASARQYGFSSPIIVQTRSKEELQIDFSYKDQKFSNVSLTGTAQVIFRGDIILPSNNFLNQNPEKQQKCSGSCSI